MEDRDGRERISVGIAVLVITIAFMGCYRGGKGVPLALEREDVTCERSVQAQVGDDGRLGQVGDDGRLGQVGDDGRLELRVDDVSPRVLLGMQVRSELTEEGAALVFTTTGDVAVADIRTLARKTGELLARCCEWGPCTHCCYGGARCRPMPPLRSIRMYNIPGGAKLEVTSLDESQARQLVSNWEKDLIQAQEAIRKQEAGLQHTPLAQ